MGGLVHLRELIKTAARGPIVDLNVLFRHYTFDALFERILARAVSPHAAPAVVRAFHFLGLHTAAACAQSAAELTAFTRWYARRLFSPPPPRREASNIRFLSPTNEQRVYPFEIDNTIGAHTLPEAVS